MAFLLVYVCVAMSVVMVNGGWNDFPTMLRPAVAENGLHFGVTLALDDKYLVVGTNMDDEPDLVDTKINVGSVTIFKKATGPWDKMTKIVPASGVAEDKFGSDVNIHDGVVIIGDRNANIAIYKTNTATWTEDERKNETDASCGYSVGIYDPYVVYGCPDQDEVKIYKKDNDENYFTSNAGVPLSPTETLPLQSQTITGVSFGDELAMYGLRLAISSTTNVYIYITNGTNWTLEATINKSPLLRKDGRYGRSISMYDGRLVIASKNSGKATIYIYKKDTPGSTWSKEAEFTAVTNGNGYEGVSVSIYNENIIAGFYDHTGDTSAGSVRIYRLATNGNWADINTNLVTPDAVHGDMYGRSVATYGDNFVAGAPYDDDDGSTEKGAVYIFDKSSGWTTVLIDGTFSLSMTMALYQTDSFITAITGPLVINDYGDYIYVGIKETNANTHFKFIVSKCWATPSSSSTDATTYKFYENKCSADSTFKIVQSSNEHFNFKVNAFDFTSQSGSSMYIHCQVFVCRSDDTSCTQTCSGKRRRRRRSESNKSNILADFVLASNEIILVTSSCSNTTCPSNSKCFDVGRARCICDNDYVFSMATTMCTNERILRINGIHLDIPWLDTYTNETSTDLARISFEKERTLLMILKERGADDVIDGLRLVNARKKSIGVVFDVIVSHTSRTTQKTAYVTFMTCIRSVVTSVQNRVNIRKGEGYKFIKKTQTKRKKLLKNWVMTLVVIGVICAALFIIPLSLYVGHRLRMEQKEREYTKENEVGTENTGAETSEELENTVA